MPAPHLDRDRILEMAAGFRPACVLGAAAELNLFTALAERPASAAELAGRLSVDPRGLRILLDATAALGLLEKQGETYRVPDDVRPLLAEGPDSALPMVWHSMSILRGWTQLAARVRSGELPPRQASIRGADADRAAFVAAMHTVSGPIADPLVFSLGPPKVTHLLDVGGASGTWTLAFLRAVPGAQATIFDLPDAIEQARQRIESSPFAQRIRLVPGDFYRDELPAGADYAWISAIIHQHSRAETRKLLAKVFRALPPGGQVGIRDMVMQPDRTRPVMGALFAVNMLVNTETGDTYTFDEIAEDLLTAGFADPRLSVPADDMTAVVEARKPA